MKMTSLCYIERNGKYLMLHRTAKENDENRDKWIGVGGKFEDRESPEECTEREIREETGLNALKLDFRGIVTFVSNIYPTEYMHLFTCTDFCGSVTECDEGKLEWIAKDEVLRLNLWEGDKIFLKLIAEKRPFFSLKLEYEGEKLIRAVLDGRDIL